MFNRRRRRAEEAVLREFDQIAANARHFHAHEFNAALRDATPDPAPAQSASETGEDFLPSSLRARGQRQYAGRMMRYAGPLEIDGSTGLRLWEWCSGLDLIRGFVPASGLLPA